MTHAQVLLAASERSERTLLGLCLLEPERVREVDLCVNDFLLSSHRELFSELLRVDADGEAWDQEWLVTDLLRRGRLEAVGGPAYLADLTIGVPRKCAVTSHVAVVLEASNRLRAAKLGETLVRGATDPTKRPERLVAEALADMQALSIRFDERGFSLPNSSVRNLLAIRPELLRLSDVSASKVEWLWDPYLPVGMLSMLSGDPGSGKTYLALAIAAALSCGKVPSSADACSEVSTLYLSKENSPEHVVRPRFDTLGGNPEKFTLLQGSLNSEGQKQQRGAVTLRDVELLDSALAQTGAGLLIVDPIQSYLGADVDAHRSNETRPVLDGLARLASEHSCCVLLVRHLSKGSGGRAIHRGLGSIDLTGAVRTELIAGTSAQDGNDRALIQVKSNLGRLGEPLGFEIDEQQGFVWTGATTLTQEDLLSAEMPTMGRKGIDYATNFLLTRLAVAAVSQKTLVESAECDERTLQRAAKRLNVTRTRDGERGAWIWSLPGHKRQEKAYPTTLQLSPWPKSVVLAQHGCPAEDELHGIDSG